MKIIINFLAIAMLMAVGLNVQGQSCDSKTSVNVCIPKLAGGFNFVKSYEIDGKGGSLEKVEYSYPFAKGTQYMINLCSTDNSNSAMIVTLYDGNRRQLATSVLNGQYVSAIVFTCQTTGIYYLTYTFGDVSAYCGGSALGFKR